MVAIMAKDMVTMVNTIMETMVTMAGEEEI